MKLKSLKMPKEKLRRQMTVEEPERPRYPWGTKLTLDKATLKKLDLKVDNFEIGDTVMVMGKAKITELIKNISESNENERIELQITDMDIKARGGLSINGLKLAGKEM